ncbi:MAG TPA: LysR family transcriptional regulator [Polyangiaceae bacterium]
MNWDDLRYFLSVATHGSTLAASAALKTSQSTVFRRIGALEEVLGVKLFERQPSGYVLTAAGTALLPLAQKVEAAVSDVTQVAGREARQELSVIRLSVPDAALDYVLPPVMAEFRKKYPDIRLEILASPKQLDLATGEADVALRSNPASDPALFGRRLVEERPTLVASRDYAERHPLPRTEAEVAEHAFIGLNGVLARVLADWFARVVPARRVLLHPDGIPSTLTAVRSGLGLGVLPQFIVDREPTLVAAPLVLPLDPFELWIVTHQRLQGSASVRALMDTVAAYVLSTTPKSKRRS